MRRIIPVVLSILAVRIFAAEPLPFSAGFFQNQYWRDGKAEVSIYEATEKREGLVRPAEVRLIVVRETFSPGSMVKTDNWQAAGAYDVFKLNHILHVQTGTFDFYQMHSGFWRVDTGNLVKFSLASIDTCGNTYKEGRINGRSLTYSALTYWEGMDRVSKDVELPPDTLFYDELPLKLRSLDWERATKFSASLIPSTIGGKADSLTPSSAEFLVQQTTDASHWEVRVNSGAGVELFVFHKDYPHRLLEWKRADGSALRLKSSVRIPYWKLHNPGDEKYLSESAGVREPETKGE